MYNFYKTLNLVDNTLLLNKVVKNKLSNIINSILKPVIKQLEINFIKLLLACCKSQHGLNKRVIKVFLCLTSL